LDWLARNGIAAAGTGWSKQSAHQGAVIERRGVRFGFLAYTYDQSNGNYTDMDDRIAMMDTDAIYADVQSLLDRAAVVIVSMHAGAEYQRQPTPWQRQFAHAAIDAGASMVVGHHPHVAQLVESYRSGVIFYSLGNLVFDQFQRRATQRGLIADVRFIGSRLAGYGVIPVDIVRTVPRLALEPRQEGSATTSFTTSRKT
jgi:poly-gamma-glutamate synthesis protein (capsule biosynthesis protein)